MRLSLSDKERAFRQSIRDFVAEALSPDVRKKVERGIPITKAEQVAWQKSVHKRGWIAPSWPVEYGGTGWTPVECSIFKNEIEIADAPLVAPYGIDMIGPALYTFGNAEQQARFLPSILSSDHWWCQGFSEPEAGSDLAALKTAAVDHGDHYRVRGQKIWTSKAHYADYMFLLARTAKTERKQQGISFLILDMRAPGVTVRPITSIDNEHNLNEVFLDDAVVPKTNLIGEAGNGWHYAKFVLGHERTAVAGVGRMWGRFERLRRAVMHHGDAWASLKMPDFKLRMAAIEAELVALSFFEMRVVSGAFHGPAAPAAASMLKVSGSELQQKLTRLTVEAVGFDGATQPMGDAAFEVAPLAAAALRQHLYGRAATIYGGSSEVQRDIVARTMLG